MSLWMWSEDVQPRWELYVRWLVKTSHGWEEDLQHRTMWLKLLLPRIKTDDEIKTEKRLVRERYLRAKIARTYYLTKKKVHKRRHLRG
jgi:hypothetical protein